MEKEKVKFLDFVRQVSKKSGYAQRDIKEVLNVASECVAINLNDKKATTVMQGVVIYPALYPAMDKVVDGKTKHYDEVIYPRARFGVAFKNQLLFS